MTDILTVTLNASIDTTLTVPVLEPGAAYTAQDVVRQPGGKGLNVARVLHRLGAPVRATGLAGDPVASAIMAGLHQEGIPCRFLPIGAPSRACHAIVELDRHRATKVDEEGPEITSAEAGAYLDLFAGLLHDARMVALCGSLPPGLPDDYYALLLARAQAAGVPAVVDTSGAALGPAVAAQPLLVKPNREEAETLVGAPVRSIADAVDAGLLIRGRGARMVAVSLGAEGAVLVTGSGAWQARAAVQVPLNTVGSGDSFVAGFCRVLDAVVETGECATLDAAATHEDVALRALIMATACGAANTRTLGAGTIRGDDVVELAATVIVTPLS
jgi:tagatose 6-phosphate kinase